MKKLLLALLIVGLLAGCSTKQEGSKSTDLVIGMDDTFAPMGFRDEKNELAGFDVDLAKAIGEKLGVEIIFQPIDWSMKESELNAGNIDCIWNGYSITDKRKEMVNFTEPYLKNKQVIITLVESDIKSKADLSDKVVSVQKESSALEAVTNESSVKDSLKELITFDTNIDCFMDLEAKRSDAIVCDEVLARYVIKQRGAEKYIILEENFGEEEYGIGLRKDDKELLDNINKALQECKDDGTYDEIVNRWFAE